MKVALVQSSLHWQNPEANRFFFESIINQIKEEINLIVLPEMFTTGFTMQANSFSETMHGETILWLQSLAKAKNTAITGSLIIKENQNHYNRLLFVFPTGEMVTYDKRHLFSLASEDKIYNAGQKKQIISYLGWKICPLICYDLRFPVFSRNVENYDLLLYVANWPQSRINAWDILLKARSVENLCYTIGVNRIGVDYSNQVYNGHTQAIDFLGNLILEPKENEGVFIIELNKEKLLDARTKFNFLDDKDNFELQL